MEKSQTLRCIAGSAHVHHRKKHPKPMQEGLLMADERRQERGAHTVLILHIDPHATAFKSDAMEHFGFKTKTAHTLGEAKKLMSECHIDVVIGDMDLPDTNPITMLKELLEHREDVKVILMTDKTLDKWGAGIFWKSGAVAVVTRPYRLKELVAVIDSELFLDVPRGELPDDG